MALRVGLIARGMFRFVIDAADPFIVPGSHGGLVVPSLIQRSWGERPGQAPRCLELPRHGVESDAQLS